MTARLDSLHVSGTLTCDKFTPPEDSIGNAAFRSGDYLAGDKIQHGLRLLLAQDSDAEAAAQTRVVHVAVAAGTLMAIRAGCVDPCSGDAEIIVDVLKNGSSVLVSPITLDSNQNARETVSGTINSEALAADDVLEVEITVDAGTGSLGAGVFVSIVGHENPQ